MMTPQDAQGWTSLGTLLGIMVTGFMQYMNSKRQQNAFDRQNDVSEKIHTLVNSNMGAQLKLSMTALARVASLTNLPDDIAIAQEAARAYREHQLRQGIVDRKE